MPQGNPEFPTGGGGGIQFDVDNVGDWLDIETTSVEPGPNNGITLKSSGDGNAFEIDTQGGFTLKDLNAWGIILESLTGPAGAPDILVLADRDEVIDAGRDIDMQAGSFLNMTALDTADLGAANKLELTSNGAGGINMQVNDASAQLFIQGSPGALIVLDSSILPTVAPATSGALWNNGGVINVVP